MSVFKDLTEELNIWDVPMKISANDRQIIRDLAERVAKIASLSEQTEKIQLWKQHNALNQERPLLLIRPENGWSEFVPESQLQCQDNRLRQWEMRLRRLIFRHENIYDDWPITDYFNVSWFVEWSDYGLKETYQKTCQDGAYSWDSPIKDISDIEKLHHRKIIVDRQKTEVIKQFANDLLGDLLQVRIRNRLWVTCGLTISLAFLRGLENTMMDFYDNPEMLHAIMAFLRDTTLYELNFYEEEGLLTSNSGPDDWIASGGVGVTDELPNHKLPGEVKLSDMWGSSEAQEFGQIGMSQFEEFVLPYQIPIMKKFGLINYGCCEPLDAKFDLLMNSIPNIRRFSISPWADRRIAAEKLQDKYIYSYKPNPVNLCSSMPDYEEDRKQLKETISIAKDCCLEIVMKDTHTFHNDPSRIEVWSRMASDILGC